MRIMKTIEIEKNWVCISVSDTHCEYVTSPSYFPKVRSKSLKDIIGILNRLLIVWLNRLCFLRYYECKKSITFDYSRSQEFQVVSLDQISTNISIFLTIYVAHMLFALSFKISVLCALSLCVLNLYQSKNNPPLFFENDIEMYLYFWKLRIRSHTYSKEKVFQKCMTIKGYFEERPKQSFLKMLYRLNQSWLVSKRPRLNLEQKGFDNWLNKKL